MACSWQLMMYKIWEKVKPIYFLHSTTSQNSKFQFMAMDEWRKWTWALSRTQAYWIRHFSDLDLSHGKGLIACAHCYTTNDH